MGLRVTEIGRYEDTVEIRFARVSNNQQFSVTRTIKAIVGYADYSSLLPTTPYVPRRRAERREVSGFVPGQAPRRLLAIAWRKKLLMYRIPNDLRETLSTQPNRPESGEDIVPTEIRSLLPQPLRLKNHLNVFCMLLWLEEIGMEYVNYLTFCYGPKLMRRIYIAMLYEYTTWSPWGCQGMAVFTSEPSYGIAGLLVDRCFLTSLPVPGLAEKRPSVVIGEYNYYVKCAMSLTENSRRYCPRTSKRVSGRQVV